MKTKVILFLSVFISLNIFADSEEMKSCTSNSNYEYSSCMRMNYKKNRSEFLSISSELEKLLDAEEKKLFNATNFYWEKYITSLCELENFTNIGTTGWQSNIDECNVIKIKLRIEEMNKLLKFKKEDQEPL